MLRLKGSKYYLKIIFHIDFPYYTHSIIHYSSTFLIPRSTDIILGRNKGTCNGLVSKWKLKSHYTHRFRVVISQ